MLRQWTGHSDPGRPRILGYYEPKLGDEIDVAGADCWPGSWPATIHIGHWACCGLGSFVEEECSFEKTTCSRRLRAAVGVYSIAGARRALQGVSTATSAEETGGGSWRRGSGAGCRTDKIVCAWVKAWGTASSAAALSVTLKCAKARGIPDTVAKFVLPLGCLINMDGYVFHVLYQQPHMR